MRTIKIFIFFTWCISIVGCDFAKGVKEDAKRLEKTPIPDTILLKDSTKVILHEPIDSLEEK